MPNLTHSCGWIHGPEDKFCRGCGERIFKVSRDYVEIAAEMELIRRTATEKPNAAFASISMLVHNILAWASGEAHTKPSDLLKEVEKLTERFAGGMGGMGFEPPK